AEDQCPRTYQSAAVRWHEVVHKGAGRPVVAHNFTRFRVAGWLKARQTVGDIEVAVRAEDDGMRRVEVTVVREPVRERPGRAVIAENGGARVGGWGVLAAGDVKVVVVRPEHEA